jgi:non-specific serine/threonine protein kinase
VGRERELDLLRGQLSGARLLTLTGPAGSGKTRLALQLAAEVLEHYPDGIWFLDLAALTDPALVAQTAASALGLKEQTARSPLDVLADHLKSRRLLLVLDNCEHLIGACAALAERLLRAGPDVRILATSRESLSVAGEVAWPLPPLATPDPRRLPEYQPADALTQYEAVRLFIDRALLVQPTFAVTNANAPAVAQVCQQLEGIPLAIELAAARVKVMTVEQIAARLSDRFRLLTGGGRMATARHQTLRAAIDWSYDLLSEPERLLLRRLSVFAGGWTLEAAEAVCAGEGIEGWEVLDLQTHLVDKSLVLVEADVGGEARYRLLGTIRQYAGDRLQEAGEASSLRDRHRNWFLKLAESAEGALRGPEPGPTLDRLELEHDNLRAALEWSLESPAGADAALRLVGFLYLFWSGRAYLREGSHWAEAALTAGRHASPAARAMALHAGGGFAWRLGDYARARSLLEEAESLRRPLNDPNLARTLYMLGIVLLAQGGTENLDRAQVLNEESLSLARERRYDELIANLLTNLGELARMRGDYASARSLYEQSLEVRGKGGPGATTLINLGLVAFAEKEYEKAGRRFEESLELCRATGYRLGIALCLAGLAGVHAMGGERERAARLLGAAEADLTKTGDVIQPGDQADYERFVAAARAGLDEASFKRAWAEGARLSLEQAIELAFEKGHDDA